MLVDIELCIWKERRLFCACLSRLAHEYWVSVKIWLQPASPIKGGDDGLLPRRAFSLGSRIHVHLVLLPLHLLRLAWRNANFPSPCKNKASFLRTCRLLEAISIISVHQSLFGQVRKDDLDLSSLARDPFLSSPLGIRKTRGIEEASGLYPYFFSPYCLI